jgi:glycosyltransferase involved in cell wall biosynthesis
MNKISIITVNYNDREGLKKTIESVINQTWQDFEFIVIDGGSTDGGTAVIEQFKDKIDYWISEPDTGVYHALNKGIKVSTGDFLIFMNSGDTFHDNNVLEVVASQLVSNIDIYYGNNYKVKANGSKSLKTYPERLDFSFFYNSNLNHQSTFIRRSLFEKYFYYNEDYKILSDWEFFICTICKENVPYKYLNTVICNYDFTGMSSTGIYEKYVQLEREEVLNKYFLAFVDDYKRLKFISSKRGKQFIYIQKFHLSWKILKGLMSLLLVFVSKNKFK